MSKIQTGLALLLGAIVNLALAWHMIQAALIADRFNLAAAQTYLEGLTPLYAAVPLAGLALWLIAPNLSASSK